MEGFDFNIVACATTNVSHIFSVNQHSSQNYLQIQSTYAYINILQDSHELYHVFLSTLAEERVSVLASLPSH